MAAAGLITGLAIGNGVSKPSLDMLPEILANLVTPLFKLLEL